MPPKKKKGLSQNSPLEEGSLNISLGEVERKLMHSRQKKEEDRLSQQAAREEELNLALYTSTLFRPPSVAEVHVDSVSEKDLKERAEKRERVRSKNSSEGALRHVRISSINSLI